MPELKNNLTITNIHFGKDNRSKILYAELRGDGNSLITVATLDYITNKLIDNKTNDNLHWLSEI